MTIIQWIRCGWAWLRGRPSFEFVTTLPHDANGRLDWTLARHADLWFPGYRKQTIWRGCAVSGRYCGENANAAACRSCELRRQYVISHFDRVLVEG